MCGICGVVGGDPGRERDYVARMNRALEHRGPDDSGVRAVDGAVLGNRRLSVIDPAAASQPLSNADDSLWITFNGEIYNYRTLRAELEARGHRFRTHTDTEVVVHLYEEEGARAVERLRGMFAFAIWDGRRRTLFAARDPFGQKPFHYAVVGDRFLFGSEIKALLAHPDVSAEPEPEAIDHYLAQRFVPPPLTMLRGLQKLPAGHRLEWRDGQVRVEAYWRPDFRREEQRPDEEWIAGLEERVDRAVERHLVSDVPVGALLSGGLDSSVVVASMARVMGGEIPTFCVGSEVAGYDERAHARRVAEHLGTRHRERGAGDEVLGSIPELVRCLDEPSDPIAACTFEAARLASEDVTVALGGDGGDEIFAGFDRYAAFAWAERYGRLPGVLREGLIRPAVRLIPGGFGYKSLAQRARWIDGLGGRRGGALYARMTSVFRFGPEEKAWLYGPTLAEATRGLDAEALITQAYEGAPARDALHRMLYTDLVTRLPEHSLLLSDRLSMAHGLELRSPLLDLELAEYCGGMPSRLKIDRGRTKVALREAFRGRLPASIIRRKKQGFMLPVAYWLHGSNLRTIRDALRTGPLASEGWILPAAVDRLLGEHERGRADHHVRIWMLLNLDVWCRTVLGLGGDQEWTMELARTRSRSVTA